MEKLKLDVDELVVASFSPAEADQEGGRGTVQAHSRTFEFRCTNDCTPRCTLSVPC